MANKKNEIKPFNLLYSLDPQKKGIDKVYDFVTVQGRYIVVFVMFVIIIAFLFRFPLDRKLNDEINRAAKNQREIEFYAGETEKKFRDTIDRTKAADNYLKIYPTDLKSTSEEKGQLLSYTLYKSIRENHEKFTKDISITDYTYVADPVTGSRITLSGSTTTFAKAEEFRESLRSQKELFREVFINNLGSSKEGLPKFSIDIKVKNAVQEGS